MILCRCSPPQFWPRSPDSWVRSSENHDKIMTKVGSVTESNRNICFMQPRCHPDLKIAFQHLQVEREWMIKFSCWLGVASIVCQGVGRENGILLCSASAQGKQFVKCPHISEKGPVRVFSSQEISICSIWFSSFQSGTDPVFRRQKPASPQLALHRGGSYICGNITELV